MISFGCCTGEFLRLFPPPSRRLIFRCDHSFSPAAYGELHFEMVGFVCQCLALCFEASRLVMIEILLHGMKVNLCSHVSHAKEDVTDLDSRA